MKLGVRRAFLLATVLVFALLVVAIVVYDEGFRPSKSSSSIATNAGPATTRMENIEVVTSNGETYTYTNNLQYVVSTPLVRSNLSQGIQLVLNITSGTWANRTAIFANSAIYNTLPTDVNLSSGEFDYPGPCGGQVTSRVEIYIGLYSYGNLTQAARLNWYDPYGPYTCPASFGSPAHYNYTFHPGQSHVEEYLFSGYWLSSGIGASPAQYVFHSFSPGWYTVVASNPWGQRAIGYFVVR